MPEIISINTPFEQVGQKKINPLRWFNAQNFYVKLVMVSAFAIIVTAPAIFNEQNNASTQQYAAVKKIQSSQSNHIHKNTPKKVVNVLK